MRSSHWASAALATIAIGALMSACGAAPASSSSSSCSSAKHQVEVVVETGGHEVIDRCVGFSQKSEAGLTAMKRSGIQYATQHFSFGDAVCQIDHDPASYSDCFASGQPYWALFVWSQGRWKAASTGVSEIELEPGEALGWRFDPSSGTAAPPPRPPKP